MKLTIRKQLGLLGLLAAAVTFNVSYAQDGPPPGGGGGASSEPQIPAIEWEKRQGADSRLKSFGSDIFGDGIDPNTGTVVFSQTDISLPGNSNLDVSLTRKLSQGQNYHPSVDAEFGDWELGIPRIRTETTFDTNFRTSNRCSGGLTQNFNTSSSGPQTSVYSYQYSNGLFMDVPGRGTEQLLDDKQGGQWPSSAKYVTTGGWYFTCLSTATGGGEGFIGHAPNGDKYRFDRFLERQTTDLGIGTASFGLKRWKTMLMASEVTDVNGNWVRYDYDSLGRMTAIRSNDTRRIDLNYSGSSLLVQSVTANNRTWSYGYGRTDQHYPEWSKHGQNLNPANNRMPQQLLRSATLPDGKSWSFNLDGMAATPKPAITCAFQPQTISLTHPYGAQGGFYLDQRSHRVSYDTVSTTTYRCPSLEPLPSGGSLPYQPYAFHINKVDTVSVVSKSISGSNVPTQTWNYNYQPGDVGTHYSSWTLVQTPNPRWVYQPQNINPGSLNDPTNWTVVTNPTGDKIKYYHFWTRGPFGVSSKIGGKLDRKEILSATDTTLQTVNYSYVLEDEVGATKRPINIVSVDTTRPVRDIKTVIAQDGDTFTSERDYRLDQSASDYSFGFPTQTRAYSTVSTTPRITDTTFEHNTSKWILGLPKTVSLNGTQVASYNYDAFGQKTSQSRYTQANYYTFAYNTDGTLITATDALGRVTRVPSWKRGQPTVVEKAYNSADQITVSQTVDDNGWVTSVTDPKGNITSYGQNAVGWLTSVDLPGSHYNSTTLGYVFGASDFNGILQTITKGAATTEVHYDGMNRTRKVEQSTSGWSSISETTYDVLGRAIYQSRPFAPGGTSDGMATTYDALGRVTRVEDTADSSVVSTIQYENLNRTRTYSPNGRINLVFRDGYGGPGGGDVIRMDEVGRITRIDRDDFGNILKLRQEDHLSGLSSSVEQHFVYDAQQRLCAHHVPEHGETRYTYDAAGQLKTYAKGMARTAYVGTTNCAAPSGTSLATMNYDFLGRLKTKDFTDSNTLDVEHRYDLNSNLTRSLRRPLGLASSNEFIRTYDELNNITSELQYVAGAPTTLNLDYTYDANGFMNGRKFPSNMQHIWSNDGFGQQQNLAQGNYSYASNIRYHADGSLKSYSGGNGVNFARNIDAQQRTSRLRAVGSQLTPLDLEYTYDSNSQITNIRDRASWGINASGKKHTVNNIQYNTLGQLTNADGWWGVGTFSYDGLGNILSKTLGTRSISMGYDTTANRLMSTTDSLHYNSGGTSLRNLRYDSRGNIDRIAYHYRLHNMADELVLTSGVVHGIGNSNGTFDYNGEGKRVRYTMNGRVSYPMYDAGGALRSVYKVHDAELVERISLQNGQPLAKWTGSTLTYLHADHLGTPIRGTHGLGAGTTPGTEVFQEFATPYGLNPTSGWLGTSNSGFDPATGPGSNCGVTGFTTHVKDCETGLTYMQARYYDPVMGRFLSVDPVGFVETGEPGYFNRYSYTFNDPVSHTDPTGREVHLQTRDVFGAWRHSYVTIIPNDQASFKGDPRFERTLPDGRHFATIGGGPDGNGAGFGDFGNLEGGVNRGLDGEAPVESSMQLNHPGVVGGEMSENSLIENLFEVADNFTENSEADGLTYKPVPTENANSFNSNGYTHGLLNATGFTNHTDPGKSPGWDRPVPEDRYEER